MWVCVSFVYLILVIIRQFRDTIAPILIWCNRLWVLKNSLFPKNAQNWGIENV
jgi:hypothetical protein